MDLFYVGELVLIENDFFHRGSFYVAWVARQYSRSNVL